ncbi:hypothetical protein G4228_007960 [Cervus hanglu yarkandensis]|nr:hypothetical protein G4228_007960 [Cervus hanglu yarkandensis]
MKRRRIKSAAASHVEGSGGVSTKGKRKPSQEEDKDYREFPQKKHKLYGRKQRPKTQPNPKAQTRRIRKEPPAYAAGSLEEQWYLEIVDKGSVSCPTCQAVGRKTIEGLKKHMENCKQEKLTCRHCGKQLRSLPGLKYHVMANHNTLPILKAGDEIDEPSERERLRTVLKRLGKLRCMRESCSSSFTSVMGYLYHMRKCGKGAAELEKMTLKCHHCGKPYRSKTGLAYHLRSEHGPISFFPESGQPECLKDMSLESKSGGRVQRRSAKIAVYHLQELASAELAKEWPKRKVLQDLVPDDRKGTFVAGKYKCLLCQKEFVSESGVKYHINSVHAEDWFIVSPTTSKSFEKLMKRKQRQQEEEKRRQQHGSQWSLRRRQQPGIELPETEPSLRVGKDQRRNHEEQLVATSGKEPEQEPVPSQFQKVKSPKTNHK